MSTKSNLFKTLKVSPAIHAKVKTHVAQSGGSMIVFAEAALGDRLIKEKKNKGK